jgi:hypothetical protein
MYFIIISNTRPFETWRNHPCSIAAQQYTNCTPHHFHSFPGIFHHIHGSDHNLSNITRSVANEEALIDRYSDIFYTEITIYPISMSRSNLFDKVGRCISFLEAVQATIVPNAIEIAFPFPEFIGWCVEQYSHEERIVMNKQGSEVMCRVESMSIRDSINIPESFSTMSEPFNEEKIIRVYKECPSEVQDLFLQTIFKPEYLLEGLSLPMSVSIMVIEI